MKIEARVYGFIREHGLVGRGDRLLVAVSGGPDSAALFHLLRTLRPRLQCSLFMAHFDHGLRPGSAADLEFCAALARKHRVPFVSERARLKAGAGEDAARRARYDFLARAAGSLSCHAVAVGHQLDDQAETLLLHLLRGSGLQGLAAMRPSRPLLPGSPVRLVRPLLAESRADLLAYLAAGRHQWRLDESNLEAKYRRNRLRLEVMPLLESFNPRLKEALGRLAETAAADHDFLAGAAAGFLAGREREKDYFSLDAAAFNKLHPALQREALRRLVSELLGSQHRADYAGIEAARRFCLAASGREKTVAGRVRVSRRDGRLLFKAAGER
ncbi:MAG TPA: tRNA lysidine(34) synthetase TilS [bacterium]|nr:tRNA lysidine(34) synthetase TilS [bacterium]